MKQITEKKRDPISLPKLVVLVIAGSIANNACMWLSSSLSLGLYLDIVFTVALVFLAGLIPGIICAVLSAAVYGIIYCFVFGTPYHWVWYFNIFYGVVACFLVMLYEKLFPAEYKRVRLDSPSNSSVAFNRGQFLNLILLLINLSISMFIVLGIIGGIISACTGMTGNVVPDNIPPETRFRPGFIGQGFDLFVSEILSRFPVNLADKLIAVFAGFAAAYFIKKIFNAKRGEAARAKCSAATRAKELNKK